MCNLISVSEVNFLSFPHVSGWNLIPLSLMREIVHKYFSYFCCYMNPGSFRDVQVLLQFADYVGLRRP